MVKTTLITTLLASALYATAASAAWVPEKPVEFSDGKWSWNHA